MNVQKPIIEMDVHGLYADQAIAQIEEQIKKAGAAVYRIRVMMAIATPHWPKRTKNFRDTCKMHK